MANKNFDILILGGSAAGLTAAITARRHNPDKTIALIRQESKAVIPCGIPYVFGTVGSVEKNLLPDMPLEKNNVELIVGKATAIDTANKSVSLEDGESVSYEKLVLSTGSTPSIPPIPGVDKPNVYAVYKDAQKLDALQEKLKGVKDIVIVGGGFIGFEFADELKKSGIENVTIIEMLPHCLMLSYDEEFCVRAEEILSDRGVKTMGNAKVASFEGNGKVDAVVLDDGTKIPVDAVLLGAGAVANIQVAKEAGLKIGPTGSVAVSETMQTSDPDIFACGDCTEKVSFFKGDSSPLKLASIAASEARIAGANLYNAKRKNTGTIGVWSTAIGDFALATAGLTESMAKRMGYDVVVGSGEGPNRHPGCMPGAKPMQAKLVFDKETKTLIGGELMGPVSVGELINMVSACIAQKMTAEDMAVFQLGTHPMLTSSPVAYQIVNAAEMASIKM